MKNKYFILSIVLVSLFIGAFYIALKNFKSGEQINSATQAQTPAPSESFQIVPAKTDLLVKPHSPVKGNVNAKVTIVEFLDPECEACSATYPFVKEIVKEFSTEVKLVVRYMPFHQNSKYVANILEAARVQGKYWETLELLFAEQGKWANHHHPKPELIPEILVPLKLDLKQILADAKIGKYDAQILEDQTDGKMAGVTHTPTFFINGHQLQELSYEALRAAIVENIQKN